MSEVQQVDLDKGHAVLTSTQTAKKIEPEDIDIYISADDLAPYLAEQNLSDKTDSAAHDDMRKLIATLEREIYTLDTRVGSGAYSQSSSAVMLDTIDKLRDIVTEVKDTIPDDDSVNFSPNKEDSYVDKNSNSADVVTDTALSPVDDQVSDYKITYAPNLKPVQGTFTVSVINLGWEDYPAKSKSSVEAAARALVSNYKRLSQGKLVFVPTVYNVKVNYKHEGRYIGAAEKAAKAKVPKADRYVVVTNNLGTSHAGINTAIIRGSLARDWWHEMGHILPGSEKPRRTLGHSGRYVFKNGKEVLESYSDGGSFMGRFSSDNLVPPQMWYLGWAGENRVAQYNPSVDGVQDFTLVPGRLYYKDPSQEPKDALTGVMIPNPGGGYNSKFVALAPYDDKMLVAAWDVHGGTTQRKVTFNQSASPRNWKVKIDRVSVNGKYSVLRFTPLAAAGPQAATAGAPHSVASVTPLMKQSKK